MRRVCVCACLGEVAHVCVRKKERKREREREREKSKMMKRQSSFNQKMTDSS